MAGLEWFLMVTLGVVCISCLVTVLLHIHQGICPSRRPWILRAAALANRRGASRQRRSRLEVQQARRNELMIQER